jgi:autotransporter-associated beta strand protein
VTGSNDWTSTAIEAGTLQMGSSGSIPNNKNLVLDGVLDLFGADLLVSNLNGSGRVTTTGSSSSALRVSGSGTFSGVIEDGSGTLSIRKTGSNEFTLSGNNTYSGLTEVISSGRLYIGHSNALGSTVSGTVVGSGAMLGLEGDISVGEEALSITGTGYSSNSAPLYNVSGSNTWSGTVSLLGDSNIRSHNGSLGLLNTSSIVGSDYDVSFRGVGTTTVEGVIALGSGGINKLDTGVLTLSGNNTYEGATSITGGVLIASNDNALGALDSGTTVSSGESLVLSGGVTIAEPLTVTGSGYSGYGALSSIGSDNSYSGEIVLSSSTTIDTQTGTFTLDGTTAISATAARYLTLTGDGDLLLEGQVSLPSNSKITLDSGAHLKMGASDVLSSSIDLEFNGGSFYTQGYNNALDQLILTEDSELYLGTGSHTLRFAEAGTFNFRKLTVNDWSGTYGGSGVSGSAGKVFVTADVNREKLDQIDYYNNSDSKDYYTLQLESQELVPGDDRLGTPTGHSNVRISDAVTVNGEWSGSNSEGWVFSPTADNANVRTSEIESKLDAGTVSITTVNTSGTQLGSVYLDDDLNSNDNDQRRLGIEANGNVELNDYIYLYTTYNNPGHHVTIKAGGNIESTSGGRIYTSGGRYNSYSSSSTYVGIPGGDIYLEAGGYIDLKGQLQSEGGDRTSTNYRNIYVAGDGGDIYLRGVGGVRFTTIVNSGGVNSYRSSYNGSAGAIEISTDNGVVTDDGDNDGQVSGSITGGAFTKSGSGVLHVTGSNDWTSTAIEAGTLQMGSSGSIPSSKNLLLSGGTLESFGATKSYGSLSFTANSSIELGSGNHTLTFSSRGSFGSAALTIKGWVGTYGGSGVSGTEGKLKINTTLSASELAKIKFYNSVDGLYYAALQLSTKEIVPGAVIP